QDTKFKTLNTKRRWCADPGSAIPGLPVQELRTKNYSTPPLQYSITPFLHNSLCLPSMKYAIIIPDGCADEPQQSLGGRTPLQAARIPTMNDIARRGVVGRSNNVPEHLPAGSDVANLSLLGYDPEAHFTGRAPLEAAAQGIQLGPRDWAIRCNLVTVQDQVMRDFTAGHISTDEARQLLA